ncbi:unnamed protein product [Adineta steineri]|uniref:SHSP domain-containing protein n=1 Tax=Adineta steineri TaxID=433720 RepID=A0A814RBS2_9BILA|nr:unnamed protein product [Adineta steineri]CAF1449411.1 unnamed protein product [Adineta steineri]
MFNNPINKLRSTLNTVIHKRSGEGKNQQNPSNDILSEQTALFTILGDLKLYNTNDAASRIYRSTNSLYDVVIRINNISDLNTQGWEILVGNHSNNIIPNKVIASNNDESGQIPDEKKEAVIATVLGAYNRGKSYLLKKLCRINIPSRNITHTEGISITVGRDNYRNIIFLDTAGTDKPVKNDEIEFKRATETLLCEVVLHLATFFIIVVNRLRATDQIYIRQVLKYCRVTQIRKKIIIVHNLLDVKTIEDVNTVIEEDIKLTFRAIDKQIQLDIGGTTKSIHFFESKQQNDIEMRHYVLAKSHSKAADIWNKQSLDGIMNLLQNSENKNSPNIINDMITYINGKLPQLFKHNNDSRSGTAQPALRIVQHDSLPYIVLADRRARHNLLEEGYLLELSEKLVYDDAGYFVTNESGNWQPRYNLYEDDNEYCLIVELAGFAKGELETKLAEKSITITGTRSDLNNRMNYRTIRQSDILIGSSTLTIPFEIDTVRDKVESERMDGFIKMLIPKKTLGVLSLDL